MTKEQYLAALRQELRLMPPEELEKQLAYYEELFDDLLEEGLSAEEAAAHLGEPAEVARELLAELPLGELMRGRVRGRSWTPLAVVLAVLGAPLWLPLLLSLAVVLYAVVVSVWAVALSVSLVLPAVGLSGLALGLGSFFGFAALPFLLALGFACLGGGLLILGVMGMIWLLRLTGRLTAALIRGCKRLVIGREATA